MFLYQGPAYDDEGARKIVWEHGRRNFGLRADGVLNIVCPVMDSSELCGVGIYDATADEVEAIMQSDPGVVAGVFRYEVHPCRSFPGDALAPSASQWSPRSVATSSRRLATPSLSNTARRCSCTVCDEMCSSLTICCVDRPSSTSDATRVWAGVRPSASR